MHMELHENSNKGAIPKRRELMMDRQVSTAPYVEVSPADDGIQYTKNTGHSSRCSLHDEVLRSALSIKNSLTVPVSSSMRRHSCNDTDAILDRGHFAANLSRRNSQVKRSPSVVSTRSRRGSKYYSGVERRPSHLSGSKKADYALAVKEGLTEEYRKEMRRRRIVWLVIGMFFFILTVSVLIVVITLTHRMDDGRRFGRYNCTC